jgi:hypothetical protein
MTAEEYIEWLENKIVGCEELEGMEKESWAFQQCLRKARKLNHQSKSKEDAEKRENTINEIWAAFGNFCKAMNEQFETSGHKPKEDKR